MTPRQYFARFTPSKEAVSLDDIVPILEELSNSYVVSYEEASRPHFHFYMESDFSPERLRYRLKSRLTGQIYISGKDVEDKVRTIAYTIKDGNYRLKNIDVNTFLMAKQQSHPKETFDKEIKELYEGTYETEDLVDKIVDLYIKYNRKIYIQHIQSLVRTIQARNNERYRKSLVRRIYENL